MYHNLLFPEYAPLPTHFVLEIMHTNETTFQEMVRRADQEFLIQLMRFEAKLNIERQRVYKMMVKAKAEVKAKEAMQWFRRQVVIEIHKAQLQRDNMDSSMQVSQVSQERERSIQSNREETVDSIVNGEISRQTISRWKEKGLLPHGLDDTDRLAAILISLAFGTPIRGRLSPSDPSYYCYKLPSPTAVWEPCPVPLPNDLPASTLLWTPHQSLQPHWLVTETGSFRWGKTDKQNHWLISGRDLGMWDPLLASPNARLLDLPGMGVAARHDIANATLKLISIPDNEDRKFTFPISSVGKRLEIEEDQNESTKR